MRRSLLPLLVALTALLAAPALATAANDLTVGTAATVGVGKTTTSSTVTYWPTQAGAKLHVDTIAADLVGRTQVRFAGYDPSTTGGTPTDLTFAAPLTTGSARIDVASTVALTRVGANLKGTWVLFNGPVRVTDDVVIAATTDSVVFYKPTVLEGDLRTEGKTFVIEGIVGPGDLDLASTALVYNGVGSVAAPIGRLTTGGALDVGSHVRTSGSQTYGGSVNLDTGARTFTALSGDIAFEDSVGGAPLTAVAPDTVTFAGGRVDNQGLSVTAQQIVLPTFLRTSGAQTLTGAVRFTAGTALATTDASAISSVGSLQPLAGGSLTIGGAGTTRLTGASTATVPLTVTGGRTQVEAALPNLGVTVAGGTLGGTGQVGAVTVPDGSVDPGTLAAGVPGRGTLSVSALTLGAGATVRIDALAGDNELDRLAVGGPPALAGAALSVVSAPGARVVPDTAPTVVDVAGAGAVGGTFAGLPEGTPVTVGGVGVPVRYAGGDGNDVVLARARRDATLALFAPARVTAPCTAVTFTVVAAPSTATGAITFRDGDRVLGSAPLVDGVASLSTSDLGAGTHAITAAYAGDDFVRPATSVALAHGAGGEPDQDPLVPGGGGTIHAGAGGCGVVRSAAAPPAAPAAPAAPTLAPSPALARSSTPAPAARTALSAPARVRLHGTRVTVRQTFTRAARVTWRVTRGGRTLATRTATVRPGTRTVTLTLPRGTARGRLVLRTTVGGTPAPTVTVTR